MNPGSFSSWLFDGTRQPTQVAQGGQPGAAGLCSPHGPHTARPRGSPPELVDRYDPEETFHFDGTPEDLADAILKPRP